MLCLHMCLCTMVRRVPAGARRGPQVPLELELQTMVGATIWVLGVVPGSYAEVGSGERSFQFFYFLLNFLFKVAKNLSSLGDVLWNVMLESHDFLFPYLATNFCQVSCEISFLVSLFSARTLLLGQAAAALSGLVSTEHFLFNSHSLFLPWPWIPIWLSLWFYHYPGSLASFWFRIGSYCVEALPCKDASDPVRKQRGAWFHGWPFNHHV